MVGPELFRELDTEDALSGANYVEINAILLEHVGRGVILSLKSLCVAFHDN